MKLYTIRLLPRQDLKDELRGEPLEDLTHTTTANSERLFNLV